MAFNAACRSITEHLRDRSEFPRGYAQNWQLSVQRDLPGSLVMTATYLGIKGTRGVQEFLPNTYPVGAAIPVPSCPAGFAYLTSNGNSTREAGQFQLRRRLHNGFTASLQYTFSKAIDDAALGGTGTRAVPVIAQNWLDLSAERGLSNFDQRHLVNIADAVHYRHGTAWRHAAERLAGRAVQGMDRRHRRSPRHRSAVTPIYLAAVHGHRHHRSIRPDYTGAPLYAAPAGLFLNPAAYTAPPGQWGNAGRNSITGPAQFTLECFAGAHVPAERPA